MSKIASKGSYVSGGVRFYLPVESLQTVNREEKMQRERERDRAESEREQREKSGEGESIQGRKLTYRCLYDRIVIKRRKV